MTRAERDRAALVAADEANRADAAEAALAERTKERDRARNDEWLAAISAVQYMEANWYQDCRSEVERSALERVAKDFVDDLASTYPGDIDGSIRSAIATLSATPAQGVVEALPASPKQETNASKGGRS